MKQLKWLGPFYYSLLALFLYLPILFLILFSFNDSVVLTFPLKGFTIRWYQQLLQTPELLAAFRNTLWVAVTSSFFATLLGAMAAIAISRYTFWGKRLFSSVATFPIVIPYLVLGVALLLFFNAIGIPLNLWTVGIGHVVINLPYAMLIIGARLAGFSANLEEASMDLGETYWGTLRRVTIPIIMPSLIAAFLSSFSTSFDEFALTFFLTGTKTTLPIYLYSQLRFPQRLPLAITVAAVVIVISSLLLILSEWLRHWGEKAYKA
ncbi:MAG: ABC transporter permease [Anaerolineales bacterium]|nr:ABC transporter permease [Anaerolineales bacterium]